MTAAAVTRPSSSRWRDEMKIFGIIILIFSGLLFLDALQEQISGEASAIGPTRTGKIYEANRTDDPENFKNLMTYQWVRAMLVLGLGYIFVATARQMDRSDIFSADYDHGRGMDELDAFLDSNKGDR